MKKVIMVLMIALLASTSAFAWSYGKVQKVFVSEDGNSLVKIKGVNHKNGFLTVGPGSVNDVAVREMLKVLLSAQRTNTTVQYNEVPNGYFSKMNKVGTDTQMP